MIANILHLNTLLVETLQSILGSGFEASEIDAQKFLRLLRAAERARDRKLWGVGVSGLNADFTAYRII